jgi:hypothetical protein
MIGMAMQITHSLSLVPILKLTEEALGSCGEFELVSETEKLVDMVKEVEQFFHLILDLVGGTDCGKYDEQLTCCSQY